MAVQLFLDANIYLSFYLSGKDDIEEMAKAVKLIEDEEITLYANDQLRHEIRRNREAKIAQGFNTLKSGNFGREFPIYCNDYPEFNKLKEALKEVGRVHSALVEKVSLDISNESLLADKLINQLLELAVTLEITEETIKDARFRHERGDPPGKSNSLGDALHWETLLRKTGNGNLHIVSTDGDFSSPLNTNNIHAFLEKEWRESKKFGKITLHGSLSNFFKERFPAIKLSVEFEKDELIQKLDGSPNFSETHRIIAKLNEYEHFTVGQTKSIFSALVNNSQVSWIATDADIQDFYKKFEATAFFYVDSAVLSRAAELLELDDTFWIPF
ncbi:PIN domain-containing protein [Actibacterium sp. XHP0104]|uniref:PIN domain-containing protein n=1 Tax=Actibacterium sp. XHP0104 TaxID=2984335 RepID=UPI0021E7B2B9|nr:PIN domain-containing protein [Actibacterium sp. XHP0104]MCV2881768.1 PIN domain-containing protein [Actibacterium sp. XHP0104]